MKPGDWIEQRDTPNTRGIIKSISNARHTPSVTLLLSGDPWGVQPQGVRDHGGYDPLRPCPSAALRSSLPAPVVIPLPEIEALWEPMRFSDVEPPPYWCRKGAVFRLIDMPYLQPSQRTARATIVATRPGWVAYQDTARTWRERLFMMMEWWKFRAQWEAVNPPTAWDRLLNLED